jgi:hypothetical protein
MNAFTIALKENNVGAALTLLNSTTDILRRGFKYEVQHGLKIDETPDAGF